VTNEQAYAKAFDLWGELAFCSWLHYEQDPTKRYSVGDDGENGPIGYGSSWEDAFKDAGVEL